MSAEGGAARRVLLVGDDAEVGSALVMHLSRAGWLPFSLPCPDLIEAFVPLVVPEAIVLVLPASPSSSWGPALTTAATASRGGVRVVLVAPSREVVEPLAAVAGAERALARADALARPSSVLEDRSGGNGPPPLPSPWTRVAAPAPPAARGPPSAVGAGPPGNGPATSARGPWDSPPSARPAAPAGDGGVHAPPGVPTVDILSLIDEELANERRAPARMTRVEVNVSLVSEHNFYVGVTRRLDSGGVFVSTMLPPAVGTPLEVRLGLPDGRTLDVHGEVAFVRDRSAVTGRQPTGCGVRLIGLPLWAADAIERFLAARPPILHSS